MNCPRCNGPTKVTDSRDIENAKEIRRRRQCDKCSYKFTTYEKAEITRFVVTKTSGSKQLYDREKLINSILIAVKKTEISLQEINHLVSELELTWMMNKTGVSSKRIGKDVMDALKRISKVAAVRYASVYLGFEEPNDFIEFIEQSIK